MWHARNLIILGGILRLCLFVWGEYQDAHSILKYTDIDYSVFTDASLHVSKGDSPYKSIGYRYTPLLAFALLPNITVFPQFGKILFIVCDLLSGWLIILLLSDPRSIIKGFTNGDSAEKAGFDKKSHAEQNLKLEIATYSNLLKPTFTNEAFSAIWLLNPFIATISTRGSSESILSVLVLASFFFIRQRRIFLAAIFFGLSVHFKIYPIIYAIPMWLHIDKDTNKILLREPLRVLLSNFFTRKRIYFGLISASVFLSLNAYMYSMYGSEFLNETYLYHISRKDHRHNFSIYFYHIYLSFNSTTDITRLTSFIPQFGLVSFFGFKFGQEDFIMAAFLQTFAFVMMNKVCTSQYFVWYLCLLPIVLSKSRLVGDKWGIGILMLIMWIVCQMVWLYFAYQLEFQGKNTFIHLFATSVVFFGVQLWMLIQFVKWRRIDQNICKDVKMD